MDASELKAQHNGLFLPEDKDGQWPVRFVRTDAGHGLAPEVVGKSLAKEKVHSSSSLDGLHFIHDWIVRIYPLSFQNY